jgi:hypothetical protein
MQKLTLPFLGLTWVWLGGVTPVLTLASSSQPLSLSPTLSTSIGPRLAGAVQCLGDTILAKRWVVYLHGMDSPSVSPQENENRKTLAELAEELHLRIALPRSSMTCPTQAGSICWGWKFSPQELESALKVITNARTECFSTQRPYDLIDFSNGGYLLTHWYRKNLDPAIDTPPQSMVAFGSELGTVPAQCNFKNLPPLTLAIGTEDEFNRDPKHRFFQELKSAGANAELIEFQGGHTLNKDALRKILTRP